MSCRETSAGSAFTTWARRCTGRVLSDPAVLSAFHELNRQHSSQGENARVYSEEGYRLLLSRTLADVDRFSDRGNNVRSLQRRLRTAFDEPMPSQDVVHALYNINTLVYERTQYLEAFLGRMSLSLGLSMEATRARFNELEAATPRSRSSRPDTYTDVNRALAADMGLGQDVGIVNAVARMQEEADAIEIARWRAAPQLITPTVVSPQRVHDAGTDMFIVAYGYDEASRRLEVTVMDNGVERRFAYRNVPSFLSPEDTSDYSTTWYRRIHGNPECQYPSEHEEAQAGVATRCDTCGQYATSGHSCPPRRVVTPMNRYSTSSRWSRQTVTMPIARYSDPQNGGVGEYVLQDTETGLLLPAIREFRAAIAAGPVSLDVGSTDFMCLSHWTQGNQTRTSMVSCFVHGGSINIERDPDTNELTIDTSNLRCSCAEWRTNRTCVHIDGYATAIRERLDPPAVERAPRARRPRMTNEERELALVEAQARSEALAAQTDWMLTEDGRTEAAATWRESTEVLYSQDYSAFTEDVEAARMRSAAKGGGPAIPYMTENVLDGYSQRGSGQAFGMEIEFDIKPGVDKRQAINSIAQELYEAGITTEPRQVRYGSSRQRGFIDTHVDSSGKGTWSFEADGSVDAELVTPAMYDEPDTWERLEKATEIIRRHGGIPSKRAGAHVHVGSSNFRGNVAAYTEMARILNQHEDVVYRLAANPERGTHRNSNYAIPMPSVPAEGFIDVPRLKNRFHRRYSAINFAHVQGLDTDHPEYRLWDSSLDPGTMQAQIKMSIFMKEAALRHVEQGLSTSRSKEPSGSHVARFKARGTRVALTPAEAEADSRTIRSFIDTICRRREDKAQLASLVPFTKWGKQRSS